jgi:hypothetical protein
MRSAQILLTLALALVMLVVLRTSLSASECKRVERRVENYDDREVLFVGMFLGYTDLQGRLLGERGESAFGRGDRYLARFRVSKAWRGIEKGTAWLAASGELPPLKVGWPALIAVREAPEPGFAFWPEPCSGSFTLGFAHNESWEREVFAHLGPPAIVWDTDAEEGD